MKIGETFQSDKITYSIINVIRKEVRVGTGIFNDSFPNAVNNNFPSTLRIPNSVVQFDKVWRVTELGTCAFANCQNINSAKIGYNIEILKEKAFFRCYNLLSIAFESRSCLKTIKTQALYDLYNVKSIEFGGDRLQIIGIYAFGFNFQLKYLRFPASVTYIDFESLRGLEKLERLDFCGKQDIHNDVFYRNPEHSITSKNVIIRVTSKYPINKFGLNDSVTVDNSMNCYFPQAIDEYELQCRSHNNKCYYGLFNSFLLNLILLYNF